MSEHFFNEPKEQSLIKREIVSKYFSSWIRVIKGTVQKSRKKKIIYLDLFSGPGKYDDGTNSTPMYILNTAINDPDLCEMLVTFFNDADTRNYELLKKHVAEIPGINKLKYYPNISNEEVDLEIANLYNSVKLPPTLLFADPFGYKGVSRNLIQAVLKNWGSECIIFFNYTRVNAALTNPKQTENMNLLFEKSHADYLRQTLPMLDTRERELAIIEEFAESLNEIGGNYVLPFCFKRKDKAGISHHLIYVTKNFKGYDIMKGIMAKESTSYEQGVPSFIYNPADKRYTLLFELNRPLDDLEEMLLNEFDGMTISVEELYRQHSLGRRYIKSNYKEVLRKLEAEKKIIINPPADKRRKNTLKDQADIIFRRDG